MKTKIEKLIEKLDINIKESNSDDAWMRGRISAFKGVRKELQEILNEVAVWKKEVCKHEWTESDVQLNTYVCVHCRECRPADF